MIYILQLFHKKYVVIVIAIFLNKNMRKYYVTGKKNNQLDPSIFNSDYVNELLIFCSP
jgi:hypothetical protein